MSVQDLTNTTWVLNDEFDSTFWQTFELTFVSNGSRFSTIQFYLEDEGGGLEGDIYYRSGSDTPVQVFEIMNGWVNQNYRTIEIESGTDVTNATLISWLEANATQQIPSSTITVDLTSLSGWGEVGSGTHTLTVKAKAQGYRDSELSSAVSFTKAASGYQVRVTGEYYDQGWLNLYDGQDTSAPLLFETTGADGEFDETLTVTSGYLYCRYRDIYVYNLGTLSGGVALISDDQDGHALYQVTADGSITGMYVQGCLIEGTQITLADGSKKAIEDITYDDNLLVWNFYESKFDVAKPQWIMQPATATRYNLVKFEDGTELGLVGSNGYHRIFNKEAGAFTHTGTDDTPNGTTTFTEHNIFVRVMSQEIIEKPVRYYNIITKGHFNLFANGILTSCRLSNKYKIENMKYIGDKLISDEEEMAYFRRIDLIKNNAPAGEIKQ